MPMFLRKHTSIIAMLLVTTFSASAMAAVAPTTNTKPLDSTYLGQMLVAVPLNAAANLRTSTIKIDRTWAYLRYGIAFTRVAGATLDVVAKCAYYTKFYQMTTKSCSSGACTIFERTYTNPQTASLAFEIELNVRGCKTVELVVSSAGAGATDFVSTEAVAVTGS